MARAAMSVVSSDRVGDGGAAEDLWLEDVWTWYFHDPSDTRWTLDSYKRLCDTSTVEDFWGMHEALAQHVTHGMFFVMRESVFPCWDDARNINGGCVSMKVAAPEVPQCWEGLLKRLLGETLAVADDDNGAVNGVSISPKRGFCIIKLWMSDNRFEESPRTKLRIPEPYAGEVLYRRNMENIHSDASKHAA